MGFCDRKTPAGQHKIGEGEQRKQLCRVFGQTAIARLSMTEQVLDDMERMLDFRSNASLQMLQLFRHAPQFVVRQRLALGSLHGHVPRHRFADIFWPLLHALIAGVAQHGLFIAMQQHVRLRHVRDVSRCADNGVHQARGSVASGRHPSLSLPQRAK